MITSKINVVAVGHEVEIDNQRIVVPTGTDREVLDWLSSVGGTQRLTVLWRGSALQFENGAEAATFAKPLLWALNAGLGGTEPAPMATASASPEQPPRRRGGGRPRKVQPVTEGMASASLTDDDDL